MAHKVILPPTAEPISLADAKLHLRVGSDETDDDPLIEAMISSARESAEHITQRAIMPQTLEVALDGFETPITLPLAAPLDSVVSVTYLDQDGIQRELDAADYQIDEYNEPARLYPGYCKSWPSTRVQANAVVVRYTAGYADADSVPHAIKSWMLLRIGTLYAHRESVVNGTISSELAGSIADRLLDRHQVWGG